MGREPGVRRAQTSEAEVVQYCPSCGARGEWRKCKLICINPKCSVQIILACVD